MRTFIRTTTATLAAVLLAGCNVGPKYTRPQVPAPPAFRGPDDTAVSSDAKDSLGDQQWSAVFREPELQELIRQAIANNYDLRVAAERVLEAQSQIRITRANQLPTISEGGLGAGADLPSSIGTAIRWSLEASICRLPGHLISGVSTASRRRPRVSRCWCRHGHSAQCA